MSRQVLFVAVTGAVIAAALVFFVVLRPESPEETPTVASEPAPIDARTPASGAAESAERAPDAAPAPPRRSASAPAATAPSDAPAAPSEAPAPDAVLLTIQSDVQGAQVFIDRRFIGTAPVTVDDVQPGQHQLNVSAEGFDGIARTIDVVPGSRDITVRFREVRLDASLPIVHRHRVGSCNGRLVATVDGIRYETANRDDAFTVALGDLETFEVDYQERNLRIKVRNGREYNFADPEKDADRLFVFHRDVERARGLLAKGYQPAAD